MGRMKDKLMDMLENPDYYQQEDGSEEYLVVLPESLEKEESSKSN